MKVIFAIFLAALLASGTAWAQDQLVLKKAQQVRDNNNAREAAIINSEQVNPPAAPGAAAPATATSAAPSGGISSSQQQLIERLESDFAVVKTGTAATPAQTQSMVNEMTSLAKGANKPTKPELTKLAADLAQALSEKSLPPQATALLAKDINIAENCSILTPARAQTYVTEVQTTLHNNGVSDAGVQAVAADLKAVVAEIQKAKPKLYQ